MSFSHMLKNKISSNQFFIFAILFVSCFYFWDLGNINAIRQGTEGFYLQISKEMFSQKSFMTPLYMGENHWSKPPIQFWMAYLSYGAFGLSLFAARLTMAITGVFGLIVMASWCKRYFSLNNATSLLVFATSLGMLKYSRIYMMEITLAIFTVAASLKFFDFINRGRRRDFAMASILLAMATLVKGPVALVMCFGGCGLFILHMLLVRKKNFFPQMIMFGLVSVALSSIWFVACYLEYGREFFDYFFLRENIGKFTAKSYPIRVLVQGLLLYTFPVILLFPLSLYYVKAHFRQMLTAHPTKNQMAVLFLGYNFIVFYALWFIPSQRSHHYAIPAMPLALMLLYVTSMVEFSRFEKERSFKYLICGLKALLGLLLTLVVLLTAVLLYFLADSSQATIISISVALALESIGLLTFLFSRNIARLAMGHMLVFGTVWCFLVSQVSLPEMPRNVIDHVKGAPVSVTLRKFYFVSEALGREVKKIGRSEVHTAITSGNYVIGRQEDLSQNSTVTPILSWNVWARRLKLKQIIEAVKLRRPDLIQETRVLIAPK
ncbi:MAG: glycosyltransferase family 39 protein [Bacteriovoracaceae bacterium]|nr:glycosyltransferase family 39 protein [Bacteriovoracaceae bacterium]